ncbi:potassium channel family protein [Pisciglobus halotolerans]|uniref:Trk system potassium uptake protein TrkA n=1 Tax=Pisciglobus halotolerans TaxID=745365 RepID=A0A1I3B2N1_9LACT|nr:TrkA family potassium uptake protein [Pisciglobus halotolerans]SFH56199.1 trk system potassium uptake protein TrkA [Pisciglobus halotolerans]
MATITIGILGLGRFGRAVAQELSTFDCEVIVIDKNQENVEWIEPYVTQAIQGDIRDFDFLENIGMANCDVAVVATGDSLESSVLGIMNCKKLGINSIVAKAQDKDYRDVLVAIGANTVIQPEKEMGKRVAKSLLRRHITDMVELDENYAVVEFFPPKTWIGETIETLDLRKRYEINIIGLRNKDDGKLDVSFGPDHQVQADDIFVGIAESDKIERYDYLNKLR